jgi:hypothetical protein
LLDYPGTILFVTHDGILRASWHTHIMYIEDQQAYTFDRLSLRGVADGGKVSSKLPVETATAAQPTSSAQAPTMSKNRRDRLQNEVKQIEGSYLPP